MPGFQRDHARRNAPKGLVMLDFSAEEGLCAQRLCVDPAVAARTGGNAHPPDDLIFRPHETHNGVQPCRNLISQFSRSQRRIQFADTQKHFAGDTLQSTAIRQHIVDAAGSLI